MPKYREERHFLQSAGSLNGIRRPEKDGMGSFLYGPVGYLGVLRILWTFVLIDAGFWALGFDRTFRWISRTGRRASRRRQEIGADEVDSIFQAVQRANRIYYRRRLDCLPKALAMYRFLRLHGIPAELCVGVKKYPFSGHAWVEFDGRILDEKPDRVRRYTPIKKLA